MSRLPVEGESFGRYRLLRRLGHGGMGVVYAAHDTALNREVALKIVAPHVADDPEFRARFAREAELMAQLDSPRAVRIHDHGEIDGQLFLVTQLVDGGDLGALMRASGALAPALAVEVVSQVVEGLADAHAAGVTHRDVKPANVLVRQRSGEVEAFLCDFGIATTSGGGALTQTGTVAGSLPYMAPERHRAEDAGPAGDLYSAGCLLWFALVGSAPYAGTDVEVAFGHLQGPLPQLPGKDEFSKRANAVLGRAMAKDPRRRYAGARAMVADLQALAAVAPGSIALPGATAIRQAVVPPAPRRSRSAVLAAIAVLAIVGATLGLRSWLDQPAGPTAETTTEVTRLVQGPHGRNLEPQRTLAPRPARAEAGGGVVVPTEPGGAAPSAEPPAADPGPGPVRSATKPPPPAYWCWSGRTGSSYADCGAPTGYRGLGWVFRGGSTSGCTSDDTGAQQLYVLECRSSDGTRLRYAQYTSVSAAKSAYDKAYDKAGGTWIHDGADWGWKWTGTYSGGGYRSTRVHRAGPYIVSAYAPTTDGLATAFGRVVFRSPGAFNGVPCSSTSRC